MKYDFSAKTKLITSQLNPFLFDRKCDILRDFMKTIRNSLVLSLSREKWKVGQDYQEHLHVQEALDTLIIIWVLLSFPTKITVCIFLAHFLEHLYIR